MLAAKNFETAQASVRPASMEGRVARLALLGSGTVGQAVLDRLRKWRSTGHDQGLRLVYAANTRLALRDSNGLCPELTRSRLADAATCAGGRDKDAVAKALGTRGVRILIDATADNGRIEIPRPEATMWRMVSSELDSTVVCLAPSLPLVRVGQASRT